MNKEKTESKFRAILCRQTPCFLLYAPIKWKKDGLCLNVIIDALRTPYSVLLTSSFPPCQTCELRNRNKITVKSQLKSTIVQTEIIFIPYATLLPTLHCNSLFNTGVTQALQKFIARGLLFCQTFSWPRVFHQFFNIS